jgi:hypothetical protein
VALGVAFDLILCLCAIPYIEFDHRTIIMGPAQELVIPTLGHDLVKQGDFNLYSPSACSQPSCHASLPMAPLVQ